MTRTNSRVNRLERACIARDMARLVQLADKTIDAIWTATTREQRIAGVFQGMADSAANLPQFWPPGTITAATEAQYEMLADRLKRIARDDAEQVFVKQFSARFVQEMTDEGLERLIDALKIAGANMNAQL